MKTVFDIGVFDGADTAYYLEQGLRVIAVEANPQLVAALERRFDTAIVAGNLVSVGAAISDGAERVSLTICGDDLASSSTIESKVAHRRPIGSVEVRGVGLPELIDQYGVPEYLKVDIEGADRLVVLALTAKVRPRYLSFEIGEDVDELLAHTTAIGYTRYKVINQVTFRELENQDCFYDRATYRLMRHMGYREPGKIRRAGRFFISGHSSGPVPWRSDGSWRSAGRTRERLREAKASGALVGWYDMHITTD